MSDSLISARFSPPSAAVSGRDDRLEGLRGFAAVSVMIVHGFGDASSALGAPNEYVRHLHMSRIAVLLFFVLSGYVIGLTNHGAFSKEPAKKYLGKRALRLVPLYVVAVSAGWLAYPELPRWNVLANFLFLQNDGWGIQPLGGNPPVWSLHFEVVYYLAFLAVWRWQPRILPLFSVLLAFSLADWFFGGALSVPGGWATGALFWLSGLALAWRRTEGSGSRLVTFLLLAYATHHLWPGTVLLKGLGFPYAGNAAIWFSDLFMLPVTLAVFCAAGRLRFPGLKMVQWAAFLCAAGACGMLLMMGRLWQNVPWTLASLAFAASLLTLAFEKESWSNAMLSWFRPLGQISYGLYLLHTPCVVLVVRCYPWSGGLINYLGGVASWIALSVFFAWLCELKLQPWVRSLFSPRPSTLAKPTPLA